MDIAKEKSWVSAGSGVKVEEGAKRSVYKEQADVKWEPHPLDDRVKLGYILTQKEDGVKVTCILARVPKGASIPEHTHPVHDIIYPLSGKGKIWIDGLGTLELERGVLVNVPPHVRHKVTDVTEDMEIYDVFSDAIV